MTAAACPAPGLYVGVVSHVRRRPRRHALRHRVFMLLLDLDTAADTIDRSRWIRRGGFGLLSWREADHGDAGARPLVAQVRSRLTAMGVEAAGPIWLLTMPRVLGHGFNPISVYYCHNAAGRMVAALYEVSNTFGERHTYVVTGDGRGPLSARHAASKRFYVSPFMDMDMSYRFALRQPGDTLTLSIEVDDPAGTVLSTGFRARRRAWTDANLLRAWGTHPLLTLKVLAGIHWGALRLLLKGVRFRGRPAPPASDATIGRDVGSRPHEGGRHGD